MLRENDFIVAYAYVPTQEVENGVVKHLILTSEPLATGPNVWVPMQDDDYVAVRHGMFFERGKLQATQPAHLPSI